MTGYQQTSQREDNEPMGEQQEKRQSAPVRHQQDKTGEEKQAEDAKLNIGAAL